VANSSLIFGAALLGVRMTIASSPGYEPQPDVLAWAHQHATVKGGPLPCVTTTRQPRARR
jgi:ornithine carbamoyltransferase